MTAESPNAPIEEGSLRKTLVKSAAWYTAGSAIGIVGSVLRIGLAGRLLPTELAGAWLALQLVLAYGSNLHLGVAFGMFRNAPLLRAAGDVDGAREVERTSFTFMLLMSVLGGGGLVLAGALVPSFAGAAYFPATAALLVATVMRSFFVSRAKADNEFKSLSISSALGSGVAVLSLGLIFVMGLHGLIVGMLAQAVVESWYLVRTSNIPRLGLKRQVLWDQLAVGLLTLLVTVGTTALTSIDRTVMLQRLGAEQTGFYYLGANIVMLIPTVFGLPAAVLTPRFFERFGRTKRGRDLLPLVEEPLRVTGILVGVVIGGAALALPPAVAIFWPKLAPGNLACRFALLATSPIVLSGMVTNVFYALNRQVAQLVLLLASALVTYGLALTAGIYAPGLALVAAATSAGLFLFYAVTTIASYRLMDATIGDALREVVRSLVPTAGAVLVVVSVDAVLSRVWPAESIVRGLVGELLLLAAFVPSLRSALGTLRGR